MPKIPLVRYCRTPRSTVVCSACLLTFIYVKTRKSTTRVTTETKTHILHECMALAELRLGCLRNISRKRSNVMKFRYVRFCTSLAVWEYLLNTEDGDEKVWENYCGTRVALCANSSYTRTHIAVKVKWKFRTVAMLFFILQCNYFNSTHISHILPLEDLY
jgi:hypothetical protein